MDVRFTPESGHFDRLPECPLRAMSRLRTLANRLVRLRLSSGSGSPGRLTGAKGHIRARVQAANFITSCKSAAAAAAAVDDPSYTWR